MLALSFLVAARDRDLSNETKKKTPRARGEKQPKSSDFLSSSRTRGVRRMRMKMRISVSLRINNHCCVSWIYLPQRYMEDFYLKKKKKKPPAFFKLPRWRKNYRESFSYGNYDGFWQYANWFSSGPLDTDFYLTLILRFLHGFFFSFHLTLLLSVSPA